MEIIKEIFEEDLGISSESTGEVLYKIRKAARALLFDDDKIAILSAEKIHVHKLPGGGIDQHESVLEALNREILEEAGCAINDVRELGMTLEYRNQFNQLQISYVFTGKTGEIGLPNFTEKEINEGFKLIWISVEEAMDIMKNKDKPTTYAGKLNATPNRS